LQEAAEADLLLHVVDAHHPEWTAQIQHVQNVLQEIGAQNIPQLLVFNKVDALPDFRKPVQTQDIYELDGVPVDRFFISAQSGLGLTALREGISIAISTGTGLGWLSNNSGKPITPISTRTAAPIRRWRARRRTTSTLSEAAAAAAGLAGDVRLRRKLKNDMGNAC
jgi:50S ribosomal subunit-associated GTPase HflX